MLFSKHVGYYRCKECGAEFANETPSSIIPTLATIAFSAALWNGLIYRYIPSWVISAPTGLVLALVVFCGIWYALEYLTTGFMKRCLKCRGPLEVTGGGYYDGILPNPWELVIYAVSLLLPFCLLTWPVIPCSRN